MKGFFNLRSSRDLFAKLESDFDRLMVDPRDSHIAFDFCVTAWHLVEWHWRSDAEQKAFCGKNPILKVCEHLAVGAKHFEPGNPKLTAVATTGNVSVWVSGSWSTTAGAPGAWGGDLVVHLGNALQTFGETMSVIQVAEKTMAAWRPVFAPEATE